MSCHKCAIKHIATVQRPVLSERPLLVLELCLPTRVSESPVGREVGEGERGEECEWVSGCHSGHSPSGKGLKSEV